MRLRLRKTFIKVEVDSEEVGRPRVPSMREFIEEGPDKPAIDTETPAPSEEARDKDEEEATVMTWDCNWMLVGLWSD